jgi:hypothetical protein
MPQYLQLDEYNRGPGVSYAFNMAKHGQSIPLTPESFPRIRYMPLINISAGSESSALLGVENSNWLPLALKK